MKAVTVAGQPVTVNSGQVGLTKEQAAARSHALKLVGKLGKDCVGVFEVTAPIQFKIGETFGFSGEVGKSGQMRDRDAEELAKLEAVDRAVTEVRAECEARLQAQAAAHAAAIEKAVTEALASAAQK